MSVEALDTLRRAAARHPRDPQGWSRLAQAYERAGRVDDALGAWAHALALDATHTAARAALAAPLVAHPHRATWFTRVASVLLEAGAPELAEPFFRQALWLNPAEEAALLRLDDIVERRARTVGRVASFDDDTGHGYVTTARGLRVRLHYGAIGGEGSRPVQATQPVELTVVDTARGPGAADVAPITRPDPLPFGPPAQAYQRAARR
ncbi:MAG TPA: cold shock domain-containing protein [Myxococcota bacterium]|jgi:tetratricopeptide (TPR) repeat protein|nr:cold shock domain-containing protein [Myxococcota bacterium]